MQNQPQGPADKITMKGSAELLYYLCLCHATCFSVFLRRGFGCEALGFNGFGALIMLVLAWGADTTGVMEFYFWAWIFALLFQRMITVGNKKQGCVEHSRYAGSPWFGLSFVMLESTSKRVVEPLTCLIVGMILFSFSETAGAFVMTGVFSMTVVEGMERRVDEIRVQRMHDAMIEARHTAAMYRGDNN